jgi:hypothetical protein
MYFFYDRQFTNLCLCNLPKLRNHVPQHEWGTFPSLVYLLVTTWSWSSFIRYAIMPANKHIRISNSCKDIELLNMVWLVFFKKRMHNLVMQLYKGWKLIMTGKLAIVHMVSLLILLKMHFFYWITTNFNTFSAIVLITQNNFFRLSGLNRESYKVSNNRTVRGYLGVPCSLIKLLTYYKMLQKIYIFFPSLRFFRICFKVHCLRTIILLCLRFWFSHLMILKNVK